VAAEKGDGSRPICTSIVQHCSSVTKERGGRELASIWHYLLFKLGARFWRGEGEGALTRNLPGASNLYRHLHFKKKGKRELVRREGCPSSHFLRKEGRVENQKKRRRKDSEGYHQSSLLAQLAAFKGENFYTTQWKKNRNGGGGGDHPEVWMGRREEKR